jgi:hypothetical protein
MDIEQMLIDTDYIETEMYDIPERKCFLSPWLHEGTIAVVSGQRGTGKTWLGLIIGIALSRGLSIGKWKVDEPCGVLYFDAEMDIGEMRERVHGLRKGAGDSKANFHLCSASYVFKSGDDVLNLALPGHREALTEFLTDNLDKYRVLIIDNKSAAFPGINENQKQDWDAISQWLLSLRRFGLAVILICHQGKNAKRGIRGTSSVEDDINVSISIQSPPGFKQGMEAVFQVDSSVKSRGMSDTKPFTVHIVNDGDAIRWEIDKAKIELRDKIIACFGQGIAQKDIHVILECSTGHVSDVKKKAITDGYLTENGSFTHKGNEFYGDLEIYEPVNLFESIQ